jgi:hypothetical protein
MRAGCATSAAQAGVAERTIRGQTRQKSLCMLANRISPPMLWLEVWREPRD